MNKLEREKRRLCLTTAELADCIGLKVGTTQNLLKKDSLSPTQLRKMDHLLHAKTFDLTKCKDLREFLKRYAIRKGLTMQDLSNTLGFDSPRKLYDVYGGKGIFTTNLVRAIKDRLQLSKQEQDRVLEYFLKFHDLV